MLQIALDCARLRVEMWLEHRARQAADQAIIRELMNLDS